MGPKPNKSKGGSGKNGEEEDTSTPDLLALYKSYCKQAEIFMCKCIETQINLLLEEGGNLNELLINEYIGEEGCIEFARALKTINYKHLQSIRIWEGQIGNQGVRAFYNFISEYKVNSIQLIELINCGFGVLGCEFLSRLLNPLSSYQIKILTLDHNNIGDEGFSYLANALRFNTVLTQLSLNYCGISNNSLEDLKIIFENDSKIERFSIQGNRIENKTISRFLSFLSDRSDTMLEELNLCNTYCGSNDEFINAWLNCINNNTTIHTYNMRFNTISTLEFKAMLKVLADQKSKKDDHIFSIQLDEVYDQPELKEYIDFFKNKKKKPKKKVVKKK